MNWFKRVLKWAGEVQKTPPATRGQMGTFIEATETLKKAEAWAKTAETLYLRCPKCGTEFHVGEDAIVQSVRTMAEESRQRGLFIPRKSEIDTSDVAVIPGDCNQEYRSIMLAEVRYLYQMMANNSVIHQTMQQAMNPNLQMVIHWICALCHNRQPLTWGDVLLPNYWRENPMKQ